MRVHRDMEVPRYQGALCLVFIKDSPQLYITSSSV